jgi:hypothetical protein
VASPDPSVSKQGTGGKTKHVTSKIPQKLRIIRNLHSGEVQRKGIVSYNNGSSTIYYLKKQNGPITTVYGIKWKCERPFQMSDNETAQISTIGQGVVQVVYSNAFTRKTHNNAYDFHVAMKIPGRTCVITGSV